MKQEEYEKKVKEKLAANREIRGMIGNWPHLASNQDGDELGRMAENKEFFMPMPVPGLKSKYMNKMEELTAKADNKRGALRMFNYMHGRNPVYMRPENVLEFMKYHFAQIEKDPKDGAFVAIHQKPSMGELYPFFLDFDEKNVSSRQQLIQADEFIESEVAVLMETIFPNNRWWWCRPTHPRKRFVVEKRKGKDTYGGNYEQHERIYDDTLWKCGIHVYTDAMVDSSRARVIWTWMHGYLAPALEHLPFLEMDEVTFSKTGLRSLYTYKSMPCSEYFRTSGRMRCPMTCERGCEGSGYLLDGPMYTLNRESFSFETFLFSSLYSPPDAKPTPVAPALQAMMEEILEAKNIKQITLKNQIFNMKGIRMDEFEKDGVQLRNDPVIETLVRLIRTFGKHPKSTEIGRITRLSDGAYVVNMNSRVCMMKTLAANLPMNHPYHHESSNNFYLINPKDGLVYLRCRSTKQDNYAVCQKKTNPIGQIQSDADGKALFGKEWVCTELSKTIDADPIMKKMEKEEEKERKTTVVTKTERETYKSMVAELAEKRKGKKVIPYVPKGSIEEPALKKLKLSPEAERELELLQKKLNK